MQTLRRSLPVFSDVFEHIVVCAYRKAKRGRLSNHVWFWAWEEWVVSTFGAVSVGEHVQQSYVECNKNAKS